MVSPTRTPSTDALNSRSVLSYQPCFIFVANFSKRNAAGSITTQRASCKFSSSNESSPFPPPMSSTTPFCRTFSPKVATRNRRKCPHRPFLFTLGRRPVRGGEL